MDLKTARSKRKSERKLLVRLAEDQLEIEEALSLRFSVFNEEMGEGLPESAGTKKDRDKYDFYCDHLIVIDENRNNEVVGTYRILKGDVARKNFGFYSESEFDLSNIYKVSDEIAELGRSCVHFDYRDGSVISLLWRGISRYIHEYNIRYLIGCGSIHNTDPYIASTIYSYFKAKNSMADPILEVYPLDSHRMDGFNPDLKINNVRESGRVVPSLIKGYLRAGARISGEPAVDRIFGVTDFFIIFDEKEITFRYGRHYLKNR